MKWMLMVLMMLCPVAVMGQTGSAAPTKAVTGDFPLTVRVVGSKWVHLPSEFGPDATLALEISAVIQEKNTSWLRILVGGRATVC